MLDMVDDDGRPRSEGARSLDCDIANGGNIPEVVGIPAIVKLGLISDGNERGGLLKLLLCCLGGTLCDSSCPSCVLARFGSVP